MASGQDLAKGEVNNVLVGSRGTISLGHQAQVLAGQLDGVWSINAIVDCGGVIYLGTSPNGFIYRYASGRLTMVYPEQTDGRPTDPNTVRNEHVFAMAVDLAGRPIAGISGQQCRLIRFGSGGVETLCTFKDDLYIFALAVDQGGAILIGTGPEGRLYRLDPSANRPYLVHDLPDKNILSLAVAGDGTIYAGTDGRGLIYKIEPGAKRATVLYDCPQPEVTGLVLMDGTGLVGKQLYAIATSARVVPSERPGPPQPAQAMAGRPETSRGPGGPEGQQMDGKTLQVANTRRQSGQEAQQTRQPPSRRGERPESASYLYRIDPAGYVHEISSRRELFFCMAADGQMLLVGTGNEAQLVSVDPREEQVYVFYQDQNATQITAVAVCGQDVYLGTANPARLVRLDHSYASEGVYTSELLDAEQPAQWGKIQIEAEIPLDCQVLMSCRSGNVEDVNDPSFSAWTEPVEINGPVQLTCPVARFCQFRLILRSGGRKATPVIRQISVASTVPNLAPVVESVDVSRLNNPPSKQGLYKIAYKARDANDDKLTYSIYLRRLGRGQWILLKDNHDEDTYEWDGRTVEDGRYEIRVVASDIRSNSPGTALTGSRISDPVVVDNTPPVVEGHLIERNGPAAKVVLIVADNLSVIGQVEYTVDSNTDWMVAIPDDGVYDTAEERFTFQINGLAEGEHILAIRLADDLGNTAYRSFDIPLR
ncbi:MAG: hypothetical protein QHH07_07035 [Sedimentisphaerales bacterium]|nr:hypothetical protein [Sedimentisphaerales bacterium]